MENRGFSVKIDVHRYQKFNITFYFLVHIFACPVAAVCSSTIGGKKTIKMKNPSLQSLCATPCMDDANFP